MLAAEIMDLLDATVVNVAGPTLRDSLGTSGSQLQWIIGIYTLVQGILFIPSGRAGDRFGRRNLFLIGLSGFIVASAICAVAPTTTTLIAARALQGLFGAIILPQGFGLIRDAFPPEEFGKAFIVFGPVFGLAGVLGPIVGGGILAANIHDTSWRGVFLINIPIGLIALAISWKVLPKKELDKSITINLTGTVIVGIASALLILPLIQGREAGWPLWCWISIAGSVIFYAFFAKQQQGLTKAGKTPLVATTLFKKRGYLFGLGGIALFFAGLTGSQLVLSLYLQIGENFSAGKTGLSNLPLTLGSGIGAALSGAFLSEKLGRKVLQFGALCQIIGAGVLYWGIQFDTFALIHIIPGMVVVGFGSGLAIAALFDIVLGESDASETGTASGLLSASQAISSSFGVALIGTLFFNKVTIGAQGSTGATQGYESAIIAYAMIMAAFLALSPLLPKASQRTGAAAG